MQTTFTDDPEERHGARALVIAWLLLFALAAGIVGWLYITGNQKGVVAGVPSVTAPIPPHTAAVAEAGPAVEPVIEPAPEPVSETPAEAQIDAAPPAAAPQTIEDVIEAAEAEEAAPAPVPPETQVPEAEAEAEAPPPEPETEPATVAAAEAPAMAEPAPEEATTPEPTETTGPEAAPAETAEAMPAETTTAEAQSTEDGSTETETAAAEPAEEKPAAAAPVEATPAPPTVRPEPRPAPPVPAEAAEPAPETPAVETNLAALPEPILAPAPDPALIERGREGPLPVIGPDGRQPWKVYARPFDDADTRPRIAVVITGLGLSGAATETAIQQLPGAVTLAFSPYAKNLDQWMSLARTAGHEVLLDLPMEPIDYPRHDPGPYTLLTSLDPKQNLFKMQWLLSRGTGYVGVTNQMGSRFTTSGSDLEPVIKTMKSRGLLFLDSRASDQSVAAKMAQQVDMPWAVNNRFIDAEASRPAIDARLAEIEEIAKKSGYAVAMGSAYPVTMERIAAWIPEAEKRGFAIAPVSAIANKQALN